MRPVKLFSVYLVLTKSMGRGFAAVKASGFTIGCSCALQPTRRVMNTTRLEKKGSPHRVVFTKNLGSYERAKKQHDDDLTMLAVLDAVTA